MGRFSINGYNCNDPAARASGTCGNNGNGNFNYLGEFKNAGDYSVPAVLDYSNLGYPNVLMPGGFYNNQVHMKKEVPDFQDAVSIFKGKHDIQVRDLLRERYLQRACRYRSVSARRVHLQPAEQLLRLQPRCGSDGAVHVLHESQASLGMDAASGAAYLGACINPNALMYLGYADTFQQTNFSPIVDMQYTTFSGFINDSYKIRRNVTLQLGARIEHLGPWVDRHNNGLATFSPSSV